ncbi:MAG: VOC family protein [Dehalococcoidia bacterium]|nr:VOC family protein [Dehalococcoidia bacterium]
MSLIRMDSAGIVVRDLESAIAFFLEIGLELEGRTTVEGPSVDRLLALEGVRSDIATLRTPDGHGGVELSRFRSPAVRPGEPDAPVNTTGMGRLMFAVTDLEDVVARLRRHGGELLGEVVRYEDEYLLCYVRGPEGILVALAQPLG